MRRHLSHSEMQKQACSALGSIAAGGERAKEMVCISMYVFVCVCVCLCVRVCVCASQICCALGNMIAVREKVWDWYIICKKFSLEGGESGTCSPSYVYAHT